MPLWKMANGLSYLMEDLYLSERLCMVKKKHPENGSRLSESLCQQKDFNSPKQNLVYSSKVLCLLHFTLNTLSTGEDAEVEAFRKSLRKRFKCGKGGKADFYIGIQIDQNEESISLNQKQQTLLKLEEFKEVLGGNQRFACATPLVPQFQSNQSSLFKYKP